MWVSQYVAILIFGTVVLNSKDIYTTRDQGPPTFYVFFPCFQNGYILEINKEELLHFDALIMALMGHGRRCWGNYSKNEQ